MRGEARPGVAAPAGARADSGGSTAGSGEPAPLGLLGGVGRPAGSAGTRRGLAWELPPPQWRWSRPFLGKWASSNRWELAAVTLITAAAGFLRLYRVGEFPAGFHGDEAWTGLEALRILEEGWIGVYSTSALGQMAGPFYVTALVVRILGASIFSVRVSMALFGIATVPAGYALLRIGFGRPAALIGTASLAVSYWHLHFSRLGFSVVALSFATTAAAAALLWAMAAWGRSDARAAASGHWGWGVAGVLLGFVPYTYFAFPTFFAGTAATLAVYFMLHMSAVRQKAVALCCLLSGFAAGAAPALLFALRSPEVYFGRMNAKSLFGYHGFVEAEAPAERVGIVAGRLWDGFSLLIHNPRMDGVDGIGGVGLLDPGVALLAYAGMVVCLRKWRSPPHLFTLLVVLAALAGVALTDPSAGAARRSISAIPWVFGLAGVGAVAVGRALARFARRSGRRAAAGLLALTLVGGGAWNLHYYFNQLTQTSTFRWTFPSDYLEGLEAAHAFKDPGTIYYYSGFRPFRYETIRFLYPDSRGTDRSREFGEFGLERLDRGPVTYLLEGEYMQEIDRIAEMYPGGRLVTDDDRQPRFIIYHLPS